MRKQFSVLLPLQFIQFFLAGLWLWWSGGFGGGASGCNLLLGGGASDCSWLLGGGASGCSWLLGGGASGCSWLLGGGASGCNLLLGGGASGYNLLLGGGASGCNLLLGGEASDCSWLLGPVRGRGRALELVQFVEDVVHLLVQTFYLVFKGNCLGQSLLKVTHPGGREGGRERVK